MAKKAIQVCVVIVFLCVFVVIAGCGGGSSGSVAPPPTESFSIVANPTSVSVSPSSSTATSLTLTSQNGFSGTVSVSISGLPTGVTSSPSSPFTLSAASEAIVLTASPTVASGTYSLTFQGSSGGITSQAAVSLTIAASSGALPGNRTNFVVIEDTVSSIAYDSTHNLIYTALPHLSRVDVIDPGTFKVTRRIPVPDAKGVSLSPDGSRVLVSGLAQQVAWIDANSQQIVERDILPTLDLSCCSPLRVTPGPPMVMANGKVLFVEQYPVYSPAILEWDPVAMTITQVKNLPSTAGFGQGTFGVRSADGSKAIFSTNTYPGSVALFDSATDAVVAVMNVASSPFAIAANPNGTQFVVAVDSVGTAFVDGNLKTLAPVPVSGTLYGMVYSPDGKYLYAVVAPNNVAEIMTVDTSNFQLVGQAPALSTGILGVGREPTLMVETPMAADSTGMIFGMGDHGVALDDSTFSQNIPSTVRAPVLSIVDPSEGPTNTSTSASIGPDWFTTAPDVWFGTLNGTGFSVNASGQASATAPPCASVGSVNVKVITPDGTEGNIPNGFTYGVVPISLPIQASPPGGGVSVDLFGYGFGADLSAAAQVQFGKNTASIQENVVFGDEYTYGYPSALQHIRTVVPSGAAGPVDITIASAAGKATFLNGLHYLQDVRDYPSSDVFQFVLYDSKRQQVYLSAGTHIDVFSISGRAFVSPITPPSLSGNTQILGLALTPDNSKLLAANQADNSLSVIDPDNPSSAQVVQILAPSSAPSTVGPTEVVATSTNQAFVITSGGGTLYSVDLSSLSVSVEQTFNFSGYLSGSRDGSQVLFAIPGFYVYVWNAATKSWLNGQPGNPLDATISGDGNILALGSAGELIGAGNTINFVDPLVNRVALAGLPEYLQGLTGSKGIKLNDAGSLVYLPVVSEIPSGPSSFSQDVVDIYDVARNELRERVLITGQFPYSTQGVLNGMAIDPEGQNIFLITQTGLTTITLDAVPLSIGSVNPKSGPAGTSITIRGSGFSSNTLATFNGVSSAITFLDPDTIQVTVPGSLSGGAVSITLTDPGGFDYTLDAAFLIQ